jgi:plastocyanin
MRRPLLALAAAALGTTLAGCGSSDDTASGCTPGPTVDVGAQNDLHFDAERYETGKGCVEFVYTNEGSTAHTLLIEDVKDFKLAIGDEATGAVELAPGTYTLFCDIAGHRSAGMEAELTVS